MATPASPPQPPLAEGGAGAVEGLVTRNFVTLGGGEMVARLIGFAGTIYLARQLGVAGYGIIGFSYAVLLYVAAVGDLGMEQLGPREIADAGADAGRLAGSVLLTRLAVSAALAVLLALAGVFGVGGTDGHVLALYGLALVAMGANARWVHLGFERSALVSVSRVLTEALKVALLVILVHGPRDILRVPLAQFAGDGVAALLLWLALRRRGIHPRWRIQPALARAVVHRALPLLLANLLALLIYNADVVLLRVIRDPAEVGLYLAAYTLINFLGVLGNIATLSLVPALRRLREMHGQAAALYHTAVARVSAAGLPLAAGGLLLATAIIQLVFGPAYASAAPVLRVLILSIPLLLLRSVLQAVLIAAGRQDRVLHVTAWAAAINVAGNAVAIPLLGMMGAAITTVAAELARALIAQRYAAREGFAFTGFARLWRPAAAVAVMAGVLLLVGPVPVWLAVPAGAAVYTFVLLLSGGITLARGTVRLTV